MFGTSVLKENKLVLHWYYEKVPGYCTELTKKKFGTSMPFSKEVGVSLIFWERNTLLLYWSKR